MLTRRRLCSLSTDPSIDEKINFADPTRDQPKAATEILHPTATPYSNRKSINQSPHPTFKPKTHTVRRRVAQVKERAAQMDRQQWNSLKDTVRHLYIDQNLNCKQVAAILREQHDDRVRYISRPACI